MKPLSIAKAASAVMLLASLALVATDAFGADLIGRQGDDSVRLTDRPCVNPLVLARLDPKEAKHFREASAVFQGKGYKACWRVMGTSAYLVYEDGDQGMVPAGDLKPATEA